MRVGGEREDTPVIPERGVGVPARSAESGRRSTVSAWPTGEACGLCSVASRRVA